MVIEKEFFLSYHMNMNLDFEMRKIIKELVSSNIPLLKACEEFKLKFIEEALAYYGGNIKETAKALGVHRNTISNILNKKIQKVKKNKNF